MHPVDFDMTASSRVFLAFVFVEHKWCDLFLRKASSIFMVKTRESFAEFSCIAILFPCQR